MDNEALARMYASGRVFIAGLMLLFPGWLMRDFLGPPTRRTRAVARMLGARELVIGAGALVAMQDEKTPLRPWMTYAAVCDAADAVSILLAYRHMPRWRRFVLLVMALSGAATGGYLMTRVDD